MPDYVVKRNGDIVKFDIKKIENAVRKAIKAVNSHSEVFDLAEDIAFDVELKLDSLNLKVIGVEKIQDFVEDCLIESGYKEVCKEYIRYRSKRNIIRNTDTLELFNEIVETKSNDVTRENANMNADTPAGMMMKFASETSKLYTKEVLLKPEVVKAIEDNYIHIHDLDYYPTKSTTCIHHPLDKILKKGFRAGHGASRPARRIETASILGCISMETSQNEQHGGQSIPAFDYYLAPYVRLTYIEEIKKLEKERKEDYSNLYHCEIDDYIEGDETKLRGEEFVKQVAINETVNRVHQSMEAFIHNMNTIHSRGGNQVVFSSINYGTDTSPEGRCIIRETLRSTWRGVGNNETPIFPIQVWKKKRGVNFNPEDKNYDLFKLACKVSAKRFFPTFLNLDTPFNYNEKWRENDPERYRYELATMGCRTRVYDDLFGEKTCIGRGNLSFTSINLVRIALESEGYLDVFYDKLSKVMDIAAEQLYDRLKYQSTAKAKQFPLLMNSLWLDGDKLDSEDTVEEALKHGTLAIGFIGLAECLIALTGKHHGESEKSQELGIEIIEFMRNKVDEYKSKYNLNYSLLATPAEGLSGKFVKKDKIKFGKIKGVTDKDYYTNSNHVPVYYKCSITHKAKIEAPYHALTNGGHIFYIELDGDATCNVEAIEEVVKLMDKYDIGYGAINHTRNRCLDCGFENVEKDLKKCPKCGGNHIDTLQRITGYLVGTTERWNKGKLAELKDRVTHS